MTLGAEPKKVAILAAIVVGGLVYYFWPSGDSAPSTTASRAAVAQSVDFPPPLAPPTVRTRSAVTSGEFRPRVPGSRPDDRPDPASINPELRLDLLAKVMAVPSSEAGRNLFQFGAAPPPPGPMPAVPKGIQKIPIGGPVHPMSQQTALKPVGPPPPPPVPPINLKYYGYKVSQNTGRKEAFLLDGDDIILATENETVKQRYKIVRIALTSIIIEDTQAKSTQTLKLQDVPSTS